MGKNAYFELVTCQDGVYVEIIPPQEDGKLLAVTEITAYQRSSRTDRGEKEDPGRRAWQYRQAG